MGTATGIISKAARAVTAATTVSGNEHVIGDATAGTFTVTGPAAGTARRWGVKKSDTSSNAIMISYLNAAGNTATITLAVPDDGKTFEPLGSGYVVLSADRSRTQDDGRYVPKAYRTVAASGASQALDCFGGEAIYDVTETADCTYTLTGAIAGRPCQVTLLRRQDSTGGRTPTFSAALTSNLPALTAGANRFDTLSFLTLDGGSSWQPAIYALGGVTPGVPSAPTGVTATPGNASTVVSWSAATGTPTPTGYKVYRGTASGTRTLVATLGAAARSYSDTGQTNGTQYFWTVRAINFLGDSVDSPEVAATPTTGTGGAGARTMTLPGASTDYASTPSSSAHSITGQLEFRAKIKLTNYASTQQSLIAKWHNSVSSEQQYYFFVDSTGHLVAAFGTASGIPVATSQVTFSGMGIANNTEIWVRAVINPNTGSNSWTVNFFTSTDGSTWTAFGGQITGSSSFGAIKTSSTQPLVIGIATATGGSASPATGSVKYAAVIDAATSTTKVAIDFSTKTAGATSFAGDTGETWTLNGAAAIA